MPLPLVASLGIAAAPSILKGIGGLIGIGKGNRMAKANIRPIELVNSNIAKNAAMAEQMADTGLPQQQYNQAVQNIQRNQTGGYAALGRSANPSAGLNSLVRAGNDATLNLDVQDANARQNNQRFAFGQRAQLANEQNRVWDWNNRQKFRENAQAASETIRAGKSNAFGALSDLSQLGQSVASGQFGNGSQDNTPNQLGGLTPAAQPRVYGYNGGFKTNRLY